MKKTTLLLTICGILIGYANDGLAADSAIVWGAGTSLSDLCETWSCSEGSFHYWYAVDRQPENMNCATHTTMCVHIPPNDIGVASCWTCKPGYELKKTSGGITACSESRYDDYEAPNGINGYEFTTCVQNCNSTTCASTAWVANGTGYQTRTYRSCSQQGTNGTCSGSPQYQCAPGYYGSSSNGTSGCSLCPTWTGVYTDSAKTTLARGTSAAGATAITGCYVVPGTYYDATGTFKITSNCNYSN